MAAKRCPSLGKLLVGVLLGYRTAGERIATGRLRLASLAGYRFIGSVSGVSECIMSTPRIEGET
jgi:hypothetical protein